MNRYASSLRALLRAASRVLPSCFCQRMSSSASHSAVSTAASSACSQEKASPRTPSQCHQANAAAMAAEDVRSKAFNAICRWLTGEMGITVVSWVAALMSLLGDGVWWTVAAIVLCTVELVILLWVWWCTRGGAQ